jgi:hypothetical protein
MILDAYRCPVVNGNGVLLVFYTYKDEPLADHLARPR